MEFGNLIHPICNSNFFSLAGIRHAINIFYLMASLHGNEAGVVNGMHGSIRTLNTPVTEGSVAGSASKGTCTIPTTVRSLSKNVILSSLYPYSCHSCS